MQCCILQHFFSFYFYLHFSKGDELEKEQEPLTEKEKKVECLIKCLTMLKNNLLT